MAKGSNLNFEEHASNLATEADEEEDWRTALENSWIKLGSAFPDAECFIRVAGAFSSAETWLGFVRGIKNPQVMEIMLEAIDASAHPFSEWIEALAIVDGWLLENRRNADLEKRIGYLSCCSESVSNSLGNASLAMVARDQLALHGMD